MHADFAHCETYDVTIPILKAMLKKPIANVVMKINMFRMHCKIVFNFALRHDLAFLQNNCLLANAS